ncbi:unnamed protein product [Caenorhabditis auriculariae]|uniref:Uncharacterized protein n=1 Tax=Caenorhabditis auriculariae TaxID=2777116 RepID=A0A8S1HQ98_9PELO|nr:unnamed protein product [Caenorhabditis auriculariae]
MTVGCCGHRVEFLMEAWPRPPRPLLSDIAAHPPPRPPPARPVARAHASAPILPCLPPKVVADHAGHTLFNASS